MNATRCGCDSQNEESVASFVSELAGLKQSLSALPVDAADGTATPNLAFIVSSFQGVEAPS